MKDHLRKQHGIGVISEQKEIEMNHGVSSMDEETVGSDRIDESKSEQPEDDTFDNLKDKCNGHTVGKDKNQQAQSMNAVERRAELGMNGLLRLSTFNALNRVNSSENRLNGGTECNVENEDDDLSAFRISNVL